MKKRILIGYASYGNGHKAVAEYVKSYFDSKDKYEIKIIDLIDYSNKLGKFGYKVFDKANKSEFLFSMFYGLLNNKLSGIGNEKLCIKCFDTPKLRKEIQDFNPDFIISTHYYASYISSFYNKEGIINSKIMTIMTDFAHHEWWTTNHESVDYFVAPNDIVKNELLKHGVSDKKIYPFGTPINKELDRDIEDKETVLKRYSLSGRKPIYLFFAGGSLGYDYIFDYFKALMKSDLPIDVIFVSGKNKDLKVKCENFMLKNNIKNVVILGYTKDVFNLLNISDVVITKPGGTTLNECIEMKKPCILIPGIGGQESYNAKYMSKSHYAIKARGSLSLVRKVKLSLNYPFVVNSMRNKLNKLDERDSCKKIYDLVDKVLSKK